MLDKEGKQLKALVWVEFVYVSLTNGRPTSHPEELMELCRSIVVPAEYNPDMFNHRVESVGQQFKQRAPRGEMLAASAI